VIFKHTTCNRKSAFRRL